MYKETYTLRNFIAAYRWDWILKLKYFSKVFNVETWSRIHSTTQALRTTCICWYTLPHYIIHNTVTYAYQDPSPYVFWTKQQSEFFNGCKTKSELNLFITSLYTFIHSVLCVDQWRQNTQVNSWVSQSTLHHQYIKKQNPAIQHLFQLHKHISFCSLRKWELDV